MYHIFYIFQNSQNKAPEKKTKEKRKETKKKLKTNLKLGLSGFGCLNLSLFQVKPRGNALYGWEMPLATSIKRSTACSLAIGAMRKLRRQVIVHTSNAHHYSTHLDALGQVRY